MITIVLGTRQKNMESKRAVIETPSNSASVIIVTYNHRKYMKDCSGSVTATE